jgi:tRNA nucleotidyltransferase (CCA-adding enzyme)
VQHGLISSIQTVKCNGSTVLMAHMDLDQQIPGLALIAERIFELEQADALFCVFGIAKDESHLIIARSRGPDIDVAHILAPFGGGGHPQSASALVRKSLGVPIAEHLKRMLPIRAGKAKTALQIMVRDVRSLRDDWTLLQASLFLEEHNFSGAPVLDTDDRLAGILTLRDIQKARKVGRMQSPVKAFMTRSPVCFEPSTDMHEVEQTFFKQDLNHIPVVENGELKGLISRRDLIVYLQSLE